MSSNNGSLPLDHFTAANGERSIASFPFPRLPFPWPWPDPAPMTTVNRGATDQLPFGNGDIIEVMETVYLRPDVRSTVVANAQAFADLLSRDEEAARVFNDLIGNPGQGGTGERVIPIAVWIIGSAVVGAVVGYASRP